MPNASFVASRSTLLTQTAEHALRATLYLRRHAESGLIPAGEIAQALGTPPNYTGRIPGDLTAKPLPRVRGEEVAVLTDAPEVPPPLHRNYATRVVVERETIEVTKELAPGVEYTFWTFGGSVPGKFIRVREGDEVVLHLKNASSSGAVTHNAQTTLVPAGGATIVEFRADVPGTYTMVDHAIFRALDKGANGQIVVSGAPNEIFSAGATHPCRSPIWGC